MSTNSSTPFPIPELPPGGYFGFVPNKPAEYIILVVFFILFIAITALNIRHKTLFMMALTFGALLEVVAFIFRIYTTYHDLSEFGYLIYLISVLVAPTVLAAGDYSLASLVMTKGKVRICCFTPKVTKWVFLMFDLFAFVLQGLGGAVAGSAKSKSQVQTGANIILGGLAVSLLVFIIFLLLSITLHISSWKHARKQEDNGWTRIFWVIYLNMICLTIRAFYRVAEFQGGTNDSVLSTDEAYFYILDTLMMIIVLLSWVIFHPNRFGITKEGELAGMDAGTNMEKVHNEEKS